MIQHRMEGEEALEYTKKYHSDEIRDYMAREFAGDIIRCTLNFSDGSISLKSFMAILDGYEEVATEYICDSIDIEAEIEAAKGDAQCHAAKEEGDLNG